MLPWCCGSTDRFAQLCDFSLPILTTGEANVTLTRRDLILGAAAAPLLAHPMAALAQAQALDLAKIYVGFPAGGGVDLVARRLADKLRPGYAKAIMVDNRPGAGGQIAVSAVKSAPADGSSLLLTPMTVLAIYPHTYKKLPYDPVADLVPVSRVVVFGFGVAVGPAVPASVSTVPELMAWFRANPAQANYGTAAAGSTMNFVGDLLARAAKTDMRHVPYRGSQMAIQDMMGGQVPAVVAPLGELTPHLKGDRARLLATTGASRSRFFPKTPTLGEQGFADMDLTEWHGLFAPAGTSADIVQRLNAAVRAALAQTDVMETMAAQSFEVAPSSPSELGALLARDTQLWGKLVASTGFKPEN